MALAFLYTFDALIAVFQLKRGSVDFPPGNASAAFSQVASACSLGVVLRCRCLRLSAAAAAPERRTKRDRKPQQAASSRRRRHRRRTTRRCRHRRRSAAPIWRKWYRDELRGHRAADLRFCSRRPSCCPNQIAPRRRRFSSACEAS